MIDNQVDPTTGTVRLKAEFPNEQLQLWPGQFVNVRLLIDTLRQVVVVSTSAVQRGPTGTFVFVIGEDSKVTPARGGGAAAGRHARGHRQGPQRRRARGDHRLRSHRHRYRSPGDRDGDVGQPIAVPMVEPTPRGKGGGKGKAARQERREGRRSRQGPASDSAGDRTRKRRKIGCARVGGETGRKPRDSEQGFGGQTGRHAMSTSASVSSPFVHRPIATSLLGIAVMLGGLLGYLWLPVSSLPQVDFPTIQVTTQLPGASPDVVASLVTAPLERTFGQIPSLTSMISASSFGVSQITLQFDLNRNIDAAAQDVQAAINAAGSTLPRNLPYPPIYSKVNPADAPIVTLALTSPTISLRELSKLSDTVLSQRLSEVTGVGKVTVQGGLRPAVRIQADLARLANYGIGLEDLRTVIVAANVAGPRRLARRRAPVLHHRGQCADRRRRGLSQRRRRLPQQCAGPAQGRRRGRRRAGEQQGRRLVQRQSRRSWSTSSASPAPTSSRPCSASGASCRSCSAHSRPAPRSPSCTTPPPPSARRSATCSSRWCSASGSSSRWCSSSCARSAPPSSRASRCRCR